MKFSLIALLATTGVTAVTQLSSGPIDAPAPEADPAHNPEHNDRTGTYSPKANMHTGYEGTTSPNGKGNAYSFNDDTTGGHAGVNRVPAPYSQAPFTLGSPQYKG